MKMLYKYWLLLGAFLMLMSCERDKPSYEYPPQDGSVSSGLQLKVDTNGVYFITNNDPFNEKIVYVANVVDTSLHYIHPSDTFTVPDIVSGSQVFKIPSYSLQNHPFYTQSDTTIDFFIDALQLNSPAIGAKPFTPKNYASAQTSSSTWDFAVWGAINEDSVSSVPVFDTIPAVIDTTVLASTSNRVYRLEQSKTYMLSGITHVKDSITLEIESGTKIYANESVYTALVIDRGSLIQANNATFTTISRTAGGWGGIMLCGSNGNAKGRDVAYLRSGTTDTIGVHGGTESRSSSGSLVDTKIEFAGNGMGALVLASVGNATSIRKISVLYSGGDSYEVSGGNVNFTELASSRAFDDDLDLRDGYSGNIQNVYAVRPEQTVIGGGTDLANGIEITSSGLPQTKPILSNITIVGPRAFKADAAASGFGSACFVHSNAVATIVNFAAYGFPVAALNKDASSTVVAEKINSFRNGTLFGSTEGLAIFTKF